MALVAAIGASGCTESSADVDPTSPEALIGVWQYTIPGDIESTLELYADGTWLVVDATFGAQICQTATGTWAVNQTGVITAQNLTEDGVPVSEPVDETPYTLSDGVLTLSHPSDDPETYYRADTMLSCADYAWPSWELTGTIDGTAYDFSEVPLFEDGALAPQLAGGTVFVVGWGGAPAGETTDCIACRILSLQLMVESGGPVDIGTYTTSYGNGEPRIAIVSYVPSYPSSDLQYGSDDADPAVQPWTGSVTVTSATPTLFEGTFEFELYDGRAPGPPYPVVTVANGYFRFGYQ